MTTTNSAGSCAYYTISGAGSLYFPVCHSSTTPKARGSNPPGRTKSSIFADAALFILYEIVRDVARGGFEQLHRRPPPAAETGSRSRGRGRRGQAPPKGRRPMRVPQLVRCPPSASRRAKTVLRTVFKARLGESPPGRTKSSAFLGTALFILYEIVRDVARTADGSAFFYTAIRGSRFVKSDVPGVMRLCGLFCHQQIAMDGSLQYAVLFQNRLGAL